tara:strand:- start:2384 stop:3955 length:1572 start_codon:yes stop_codon:yes gene_type:complete
MAAIITDQFRIINANNFMDDVTSGNNSYYAFLGLANPTIAGFGRTDTWNSTTIQPPSPTDSINYNNHVYDTMLFGRKIFPGDVRRLIRKVTWTKGTSYDMYRHDYSVNNRSLVSNSSRLYSANYYIMNKDYRVYVCINNGSAGINTIASASLDEPTFTDLEPSAAGVSGDTYLWKYMFTVPPADIVKFDSTEYIAVPNEWETTSSNDIKVVRDNGDSSSNNNQIKVVSIDEAGAGYSFLSSPIEVDILGDGTGGKVRILTNTNGQIISAQVTNGGSGYSYGRVDLSSINGSATKFAKLTPIIPPSLGHGFNAYKELGTDKVLIYTRFDASSYDFASDTKFAQVGLMRNPTAVGAAGTNYLQTSEFSSLKSLKFTGDTSQTLGIGTQIEQNISGVGTARGYVASYDIDTKVIKYFQDRSLSYNQGTFDQTDSNEVATQTPVLNFQSTANAVTSTSFSVNVDQTFSGISTTTPAGKVVDLGVQFTNGLADAEINKRSGEIIYLDNRPSITRNLRQKEDIKIVLEF